ncbi:MAG: hypothetical protein WBX22_03105 [Silvibacterium sp.]
MREPHQWQRLGSKSLPNSWPDVCSILLTVEAGARIVASKLGNISPLAQ